MSSVTDSARRCAPTETPIPGLRRVGAARARRQPRLVQGELAAREDGRRGLARLRPGAEQHLVQRRRRHDPRHPRRALGQVGLGRDRPDLRRVGRPARGADLRRGLHHRARPVARDLRAARRRQLLPDARARHRLHLPRERPLVARRRVHVPQPRRRDAPRSPGRSRSTRPRSRRRTSRIPRLADVTPIPPRKTLVLGADGQLGRALRAEFGDAAHVEYADHASARPHVRGPARPRAAGATTSTIINAAAYTAVDVAETPDGARDAWARERRRRRAPRARRHRRTASRSSTSRATTSSTARIDAAYREERTRAPLGVYGQTKAAGDDPRRRAAPLHRADLLGHRRRQELRAHDASLAERGIDPSVVDDQIGRLTFTTELARGIRHLLDDAAPHGMYNLTGSGDPSRPGPMSRGRSSPDRPRPGARDRRVDRRYFGASEGPVAPRPRNSVLDLTKIHCHRVSPPPTPAKHSPEYLR